MPEMDSLQGERSVFYASLCTKADKWPTRHWTRLLQAAATATMHCQPEWCTHPPPPGPAIHLAQNLSSKGLRLLWRGQNLTMPKSDDAKMHYRLVIGKIPVSKPGYTRHQPSTLPCWTCQSGCTGVQGWQALGLVQWYWRWHQCALGLGPWRRGCESCTSPPGGGAATQYQSSLSPVWGSMHRQYNIIFLFTHKLQCYL